MQMGSFWQHVNLGGVLCKEINKNWVLWIEPQKKKGGGGGGGGG
jgi:hypothetical protein